MPDRTLDEQLTKYLTDVHSVEVQALAQMKTAPDTRATSASPRRRRTRRRLGGAALSA